MPSYNITSPDGQKFKVTAPEGATPEQIVSFAKQNMKSVPKGPKASKTASFGLGMSDMASFGFDDEVRGLGRFMGSQVRRLFTDEPGQSLDSSIDSLRTEHSAAREQNPGSYVTGQVTGAVVPAIATGIITGGKSVLSGITNPIARAATAGGIQGGLYGAGSGKDSIEDRLSNAAMLGSIGALGGAGITYGLSLLGRAVAGGASKLAGTVDNIQGTAPEVIDDATKKVIDKLRADFPDDAAYAKALKDAATNGTLAEIAPQGGQVQRLTRGAAQYPEGEKAITEGLTARTSGTTQRVKQGIKDYISPNNDFYGTLDNIYKKGAKKSAPAYEKAFSAKPINNDKIAEFISQPELKTGIARGLKIQRLEALAEGKPFNPTDYGVTGFNEAGDPILGQVPNMRLLDAGKRGLDAMIQDETDTVTGRVTELGRALIKFKQGYVGELKSLNKDYQAALDASGDYLSNAQSIRNGREFMTMDADTISRTFKKLGPTEKESFKAGIARAVRDIIDKSADGTDITKRLLGKEEVRNKLKAVMSPKEYDELANIIRAEEKIFKLQRFVLGNSTTTPKAMDAADLSSEAQQVVQTLATRGPTAAVADQVTKALTKTFSGLNDRMAGNVAKILMETDPQKKLALLAKLRATPKGQNQLALEAFFETNKAIQGVRKALPKAETVGVGAGAISGSASKPLEVTVPIGRPKNER